MNEIDQFILDELAFAAKLKELLPEMSDSFDPQITIYIRHKDNEISAIFTKEAVNYPQFIAETIKHLKQALWQATEQDTAGAQALYDSRKPNKVN